MITGKNESKTLTKDVSCKYKWKKMEENVIQINGGITINVDVSVKKRQLSEKDYIWNHATCSCEKWKHLPSIMDDSAITCDEISHTTKKHKQFQQILMKKVACKTQNFYILLVFLLITIALLIAVSIYYYLVKHKAKLKH